MKNSRTRKRKSASWTIVLGDLLTLLLAFFVSFFVFQTHGVDSVNKDHEQLSGTGLAIHSSEPKELRFIVREDRLRQGPFRLSEDALIELKKYLNSDNYTLSALKAQMCLGQELEQIGGGFGEGLLALKGQFIDTFGEDVVFEGSLSEDLCLGAGEKQIVFDLTRERKKNG